MMMVVVMIMILLQTLYTKSPSPIEWLALRDPGFDSWAGYRISLLWIFVVYLIFCRQMLG